MCKRMRSTCFLLGLKSHFYHFLDLASISRFSLTTPAIPSAVASQTICSRSHVSWRRCVSLLFFFSSFFFFFSSFFSSHAHAYTHTHARSNGLKSYGAMIIIHTNTLIPTICSRSHASWRRCVSLLSFYFFFFFFLLHMHTHTHARSNSLKSYGDMIIAYIHQHAHPRIVCLFFTFTLQTRIFAHRITNIKRKQQTHRQSHARTSSRY